MPALSADSCRRTVSIGTRFVATVDAAPCHVRAATVWPIEEILSLEVESVLMAAIEEGTAGASVVIEARDQAGGSLVTDLLDSRMIVPLRPRRRRERAVSSRAHFYSGAEG